MYTRTIRKRRIGEAKQAKHLTSDLYGNFEFRLKIIQLWINPSNQNEILQLLNVSSKVKIISESIQEYKKRKISTVL